MLSADTGCFDYRRKFYWTALVQREQSMLFTKASEWNKIRTLDAVAGVMKWILLYSTAENIDLVHFYNRT